MRRARSLTALAETVAEGVLVRVERSSPRRATSSFQAPRSPGIQPSAERAALAPMEIILVRSVHQDLEASVGPEERPAAAGFMSPGVPLRLPIIRLPRTRAPQTMVPGAATAEAAT